MRIGIIGAMQCEVSSIQQLISNSKTELIAKMEFTFGLFADIFVVVVVCGIGKVNASIGTSNLINHFNVDCVINIGIAGAADDKLNVNDIVISNEVTYHDYDSRQLVYNYPNMKENIFVSDSKLSKLWFEPLKKVFNDTRVIIGKVVSGDRFISDHLKRNIIRDLFAATCLDMEGAAIAHVSYVYNIPFVLIKVISDKADEKASISFREFLKHVPDIHKKIFLTLINTIKNNTER